MGVLGLTPFIQKYCAKAIKELPNRLKSLSGKTIAIDGTLITQRLHFSPMPYSSRHVLGWYRLARELSDSGVGAICVFDGKGQNMAKDSERERRRRVRRMTLARGNMEVDRLKRLHLLALLLKNFRCLSESEQVKWTKVLRRSMIASTKSSVSLESSIEGLNKDISDSHLDGLCSFGKTSLPFDSGQIVNVNSNVDSTLWVEGGHLIKGLFSQQSSYEPESIHSADWEGNPDRTNDLPKLDEPSYPYEAIEDTKSIQDISYDISSSDLADVLLTAETQDTDVQGERYLNYFQEMGPSQLIRNLLSLYRKYEKSVSVIIQTPMVELTTTDTTETPGEGTDEQYAMSKNQLQLAVEEGKLWASLIDPMSLQAARGTLDALAIRSESLTKSYERRNNPPTFKTYEESKEILCAMGIPCVDAVGPYEAEALAASLVHQGLADYVASEDTDVLIFEVPLLRNLTNRQAPLTLVSGADIRQALKLDRPSFVDFALLLGTDFSQRIKNLGPSRAIKFIQTYRRIEEIISKEPKFIPRQPRDEYLQQVALARLVFETLPPIPSHDLLQQREADNNLVIALLERHHVYRAAMADWDYSNALSGNYFNDNPTM